MANLKKQQYWFLFFITVYTLTGIGALILGNVWLSQSADGAPREAVISREIELGTDRPPATLPPHSLRRVQCTRTLAYLRQRIHQDYIVPISLHSPLIPTHTYCPHRPWYKDTISPTSSTPTSPQMFVCRPVILMTDDMIQKPFPPFALMWVSQ